MAAMEGRAMATNKWHTGLPIAFVDFETTGLGLLDSPIEIGVALLYPRLKTMHTFESLIIWDWMHGVVDADGPGGWPSFAQGAYRVHDIPLEEVLAKGTPAIEVGQMVASFLPQRSVFASNNVPFDCRHMKHLMVESGIMYDRLFHYRHYDTSILERLGFDPPRSKHRAMSDAQFLAESFLEFMDLCAMRDIGVSNTR